MVFFNEEEQLDDLRMACRESTLGYRPVQEVFKADLRMKKEKVIELLRDLQKKEKEPVKMDEERNIGKGIGRRQKLSRREQVNALREEISLSINSTGFKSYKDVARRVCCHTSTVKSVYLQMTLHGQPREYQYNNLHSQGTVQRLDNLINQPANQFLTTMDYKRRVPTCSKKYLRRKLKASGRRYVKLKRERKVQIEKRWNKVVLKRVIWTAVQAMAREKEAILFLDEAAFPCNQTTDYCWVRKGERVIYNRREKTETLNVIALCNQKGYVAFQVHSREPNKEAIHFFLTQVLERLKDMKKVVILLDNAGWHHSNLVEKSKVRELLLFNVAYCWESNMIENTFSKMKSLWRQRRVARTTEEEVETLVGMFREGWSKSDFAGYRRQYYRQLERLFDFL
jgi:hypothetical protein